MEGIDRLWARSDTELRDALRGVETGIRSAYADKLALIRELDRRQPPAGSRAGSTAKHFLVNGLLHSPGEAARDVAAAHVLDAEDGQLPGLGRALANGEVSRAHVDVAVAAVKRLPTPWKRLVAADGEPYTEKVDRILTDHARKAPPQDVDRTCQHLLATADPRGVDRDDPDAHQRRHASVSRAHGDMCKVTVLVPENQATWVRAAFNAWGKPEKATPDEQGELIPDLRTRPQRMADGFVDSFRRLPNADTPLAQAQITIVATLDQARAAANARHDLPVGLADNVTTGMPVGTKLLAQHLCQATVQGLIIDRHGAVLHLGRTQRLASEKQRQALAGRDRGCVIPGCPLPPAACSAHHVTWWRHGGRTDIDNLALLCTRHHAETHAGTWELQMRHGIPWAIPSRTYDPDRRPRRNHAHDQIHEATTLGQQLRLDLTDTG